MSKEYLVITKCEIDNKREFTVCDSLEKAELMAQGFEEFCAGYPCCGDVCVYEINEIGKGLKFKQLENHNAFEIVGEPFEIFCPICEEHHDVCIVEREEKIEVLSQIISVKQQSFFCDVSNETFVSGSQMDENLSKIRNEIAKHCAPLNTPFDHEKKFLLRVYVDNCLCFQKDCVSILEAEREFNDFKSHVNPCGYVTYKIHSLKILEEGE